MTEELSINDSFIQSLNHIIETNLDNEQFGVSELADEVGVSRSKLHRKLNAINGKSPSRFIREFRLEKAMQMLQGNIATASEVAYRVGFGSPTYFSTSFKEYYGYPPGEVKFRNSVQLPGNKASDTLKNTDSIDRKLQIKKGFIILPIAIVIALAIFYWQNPEQKDNATAVLEESRWSNKSIAVLPLKNLSDDEANEYFAEGVAESIQNHLNKIEGLKVISQTSMSKYASTQLSTPEIGKELNVSYLLESSAQKYGDKIRLVTKLIDAQNDRQLWSDTYDRELIDIFEIQSEIAKQIATELKIVLTPQTVSRIEKKPTDSIDAYNLYQKGLHFYNFRTHAHSHKEGETSVRYFQKAIEKDPNFSQAFAALAKAHLFAGKNLHLLDSVDYVKNLALKALELDKNNSEAHTALGMLACLYEWDWETAEKEYKKALELNPNNSETYIYYSLFKYYVQGEFDESRKLMDQALELDPLSLNALVNSAYYYYYEEEYTKVFQETAKLKELRNDIVYAYWLNFRALANQNKKKEAISEWSECVKLNAGDDDFKTFSLDSTIVAFNTDGYEGILRYGNRINIQLFGNPERFDDFVLYGDATGFAFIDENDMALKYLEIAYNKHTDELYKIKYDPNFKKLHETPRFLTLLSKMNLGDYD